jgi:hypothetical protein
MASDEYKFTFNCLDRFNENHELIKILPNNTDYKNLIENLSLFQTEINTKMTSLVEREKNEIKEKPKVDKKSESDEEDDEEIGDEQSETEIKKQKIN